jgi:hypothetical protein
MITFLAPVLFECGFGDIILILDVDKIEDV